MKKVMWIFGSILAILAIFVVNIWYVAFLLAIAWLYDTRKARGKKGEKQEEKKEKNWCQYRDGGRPR